MRTLLLLLAALVAAGPAFADTKTAKAPAKPPGPKLIGRYDDWRAATHVEAGQLVCYAFTTATSSVPAVLGRTAVHLTVTERPPGGRDAVAITAGFAYGTNAAVMVQAGTNAFEFYTAQRSAFARDGAAAVQAFLKASQVLARSPNPKGSGSVTDQFSLKGFADAYAAINKACPPK